MINSFEIQDKVVNSHHFIVNLIDLCIARGINEHHLLKGTRLFYDDISKAKLKLNAQQIYTIVKNSEKLLNSHDLSFLLGRRFFPGNLGYIANALFNCNNLHEMLKIIMCYQQQIFPLMFVRIKQHKKQCHLIINSSLGIEYNDEFRFMAEFLCAAIVSSIKWQLGKSVPLVFKFPFQKPDYVEEYYSNLGSNIYFDQYVFMISIDKKYLNVECKESSIILKQHYLDLCNQYNDNRVGLIQNIYTFLAEKNSSLETAAQFLNISASTLKRKLKMHHCTFQQIQDLVKTQQAVYKITEKKLNNEDVAQALNFNDVTNFRRSFKRWTGITPSKFRLNI